MPREAEHVRTFDDLRAFKASTNALVVAPHPFYPIPSAMGVEARSTATSFDALEISSLHARGIDFNRRAVEWAAAHGKPLVGNTDIRLAGATGDDLLAGGGRDRRVPTRFAQAIRMGRVQVVTRQLG